MSADDRKTEPPFGLDMDFGEALEQRSVFVQRGGRYIGQHVAIVTSQGRTANARPALTAKLLG